MVRFSVFSNDKELLNKFSKYSTIYGVIFVITGLLGVIWPGIMSLTTAIFYGWLLLFSSIIIGMHTWQTNRSDWLGWLKAFILLLTGAFVIFNPVAGVAALGIILAIYFYMDAFASFSLAFELKPAKWWWVSLLNAVLSIALGTYLVLSWPLGSMFLVGLFVGVSLFFDGLALLAFGKSAKDAEKNL